MLPTFIGRLVFRCLASFGTGQSTCEDLAKMEDMEHKMDTPKGPFSWWPANLREQQSPASSLAPTHHAGRTVEVQGAVEVGAGLGWEGGSL